MGAQEDRPTSGLRNLDEVLGRTFVRPPVEDGRHEKWCRWLKDIDKDVTDLFLGRDVWRTVSQIIRDHPAMPASHFFDFQARNYASAQSSGVRRQCDMGAQVVTLGRLLTEIKLSPEILSRERYVSMFPWGMQWIADEAFDGIWGAGSEHVDPAVVDADLTAMLLRAQAIKVYVDKHIAHFERPAANYVAPTFDDLDDAIDGLGGTFQRYNTVLTAGDRAFMAPVPQYDWVAPFRIAWIVPDGQ